MKVIVITGSYGKKAVSKIFLEYFKKIKYKTKVYKLESLMELGASNKIQDILDKDRLEGVQVAIVQTSFKHLDLLEMIECDALLITNYHLRKLTDNIALSNINLNLNKFINKCNHVLVNSKCANQIQMISPKMKTFGTDDSVNYDLKIISNTIKGLKLKYNNKILKSGLITRLHAENIIATIAILESINLFKIRKFQKIIRRICIDGQIQNIITKNRRPIIVDKRYSNFSDLIDAIVQTTKSFNYKLLIMMSEPVNYSLKMWIESLDMLEFKKSKFSYIISSKEKLDQDEKLLLKTLVEKGVYLFEYLNYSNHNNRKIYKNMKEDETLVIFTQESRSKILIDMEK